MSKVKTSIQVYALVVCFVTLCCLVVTSGMFVYDVVKLKWPDISTCNRYSELEASYCYDRTEADFVDRFKALAKGDDLKLTDAEVKQKFVDSKLQYERQLAIQKDRILQGMVKEIIVFLINLLVFIPHWLLARR